MVDIYDAHHGGSLEHLHAYLEILIHIMSTKNKLAPPPPFTSAYPLPSKPFNTPHPLTQPIKKKNQEKMKQIMDTENTSEEKYVGIKMLKVM